MPKRWEICGAPAALLSQLKDRCVSTAKIRGTGSGHKGVLMTVWGWLLYALTRVDSGQRVREVRGAFEGTTLETF